MLCFRIDLVLICLCRKNWFAARCEYLRLIKKNSQCVFACCEFFLLDASTRSELRTGFCDDWKRDLKDIAVWPAWSGVFHSDLVKFQAHVGFRDAFLVNGCLFFLGIICLICTRPYRLPPRRRCLFYLQKNLHAGPLVLAELVVIGNQTKEPVLVPTLHDFSYGNHFIHDVSLARSLSLALWLHVFCVQFSLARLSYLRPWHSFALHISSR